MCAGCRAGAQIPASTPPTASAMMEGMARSTPTARSAPTAPTAAPASRPPPAPPWAPCLLYTSDAADDM
eukprot:3400168-Prymnesium_polylepis.1